MNIKVTVFDFATLPMNIKVMILDFANRICIKPHVIATFNVTAGEMGPAVGYTWQLICIGLKAVALVIKLTEGQQR